ncbi:MAG TPA: response regulator [Verrucomicrobiae bacterium]|nr:response regulator [Verrucomicrobiae bacterium]
MATEKNAALAGKKILLAEDDPVMQQLFRILLTRKGADAVVAGDGRTAVELYAEGDFAAVLLDIQMPVMGGIEAAEAIREIEREKGRRVPLVAVTADAMAEDEEALRARGFDDCVSKPLDFERFFATLERHLA